MNEINNAFASVLSGLAELASTVNQINHGLRAAFRLDPAPAPSLSTGDSEATPAAQIAAAQPVEPALAPALAPVEPTQPTPSVASQEIVNDVEATTPVREEIAPSAATETAQEAGQEKEPVAVPVQPSAPMPALAPVLNPSGNGTGNGARPAVPAGPATRGRRRGS